MKTGRGVRVAVIDSGVHAAHPHVDGIADGFAVHADGSIGDDFVDRLGHGTAVTAAIKEKAPDVDILTIKIFDRSLSTTAEVLATAIRTAIARHASLINLSLGTVRQENRELLESAVHEARRAGVAIVAAAPTADRRWLPGDCPDVIPVALDWTCPRDAYRRIVIGETRIAFSASGYPRAIPGVSPERNLKGQSFSVANVSGFAACALENCGRLGPEQLTKVLADGAEGAGQIPQ